MYPRAVTARRLDIAAPGLVVPPRPPLVVGHRGAAGLAPENTLESVRAGIEAGAEMIEVDLQATGDGRIVLLHDPTLDRTTDGSGDVRAKAWDEIRRLDASWPWSRDGGRTYPFRGRGIGIPRLEDALAAFPDTLFALELKPTLPPRALRPLARILAPHAARVIAGSEDHALLSAFRTVAPGVPTGLSAREVRLFHALALAGCGLLFRSPGRAFQVPPTSGGDRRDARGARTGIRVLTPRFLAAAHRTGRAVVAWTVNEESEMRALLDLGVDGITTDRPDIARAVIDAAPESALRS